MCVCSAPIAASDLALNWTASDDVRRKVGVRRDADRGYCGARFFNSLGLGFDGLKTVW